MAGTFILSLDTELAWGTFDVGGLNIYRRHLQQARHEIRRLIDLLDEYEVPATWAFVGHLFLDSCQRQEGSDPHPDVLTPKANWYSGHWHQQDPGTDVSRDHFWYGPDILEWVRSASVQHEIGCHTFSHVIMNDPSVTEDIAYSQIAKCCVLATERGIQMDSFVFPRNGVAHLPVLKRTGFRCYRGPEVSWYRSLPSRVRPVAHFIDRMFGLTPPIYTQIEPGQHGLINIPGSMFFMPPDGLRKIIPGAMRVRQAIRGLNRAAEEDGVFHLWFHPWNLGSSPLMIDWLREIFSALAVLRASGNIQVKTMGQMANQILGVE